MPWTLKYSDDFNRSNRNPLGAPWGQLGGTNDFQLLANTARGTVLFAYNTAVYAGGALAQSHAVEIDMLMPALDPTYAMGGFVRYGFYAGARRGYIFYWVPGSGTPGNILLNRYQNEIQTAIDVGGTYAVLGGTGVNFGTLRVEAVGVNPTNFFIYQNGTLLGTGQDTVANLDQGNGGLYTNLGGSSIFDNYKAYEYSGKRHKGRHWGGELWGIIPEVAAYLG